MKVTDEMVKTVAGHLLVTTNDTITGLRDGLEDALADVPEPEDLVLRWARWMTRALDAEAKLSQVRAWHDSGRHDLKRLRAALDGEE